MDRFDSFWLFAELSQFDLIYFRDILYAIYVISNDFSRMNDFEIVRTLKVE